MKIDWVYGTRKKKRLRRFMFCVLVLLVTVGVATVWMLDGRIVPTALEIIYTHSKSKINSAINDTVSAYIDKNRLLSDDFYIKSTDAAGKTVSLEVNTMLVNVMCSQLAVDISKSLRDSGMEVVEVPLGAMTGVSIFAGYGPLYPIRLMPAGEALVDYRTSFESVGINQVNYRVWLDVKCEYRVVNPLQDKSIIVEREVALVDTVFTGEIPSTYIDVSPKMPLE